LYKQVGPLSIEGLLVQERKTRITYVYLTKKGANWKPEKEKKSKKEKKKEKKEKRPWKKDWEKEKAKEREPIITKEEKEKETGKVYAKPTKREEIKDLEIKQHAKTHNISYKEAEEDLALLSLGKGDIPALKEEKKGKPVEEPKAHVNVKKERENMKDLLRELLLNIVVRKTDSVKYGMKSNVYKGYMLKMIDILAKTDEHWQKHNIRVENRKVIQG